MRPPLNEVVYTVGAYFCYLTVGTVPQPGVSLKGYLNVFACFWCVSVQCTVLGEPLRRSQPAGHSSLVISVYLHFTDILRSQFLVCGWKMLLECHTKQGAAEYPLCTSFPSVFRRLNVYYCGFWWLALVFLFHCLTVFVFFSQHLTVLGRIFPFEKVRLEALW